MNGKMRQILFSTALVVVLILLGILLYNLGKENMVFIDNKEVALDGTTYTADAAYRVWIDGKEICDVNPDRRKMAQLVGANHKLTLEVIDDDANPIGKKFEKKFSVKKDKSILNLSAMVGGAKNWVLPPEPVE